MEYSPSVAGERLSPRSTFVWDGKVHRARARRTPKTMHHVGQLIPYAQRKSSATCALVPCISCKITILLTLKIVDGSTVSSSPISRKRRDVKFTVANPLIMIADTDICRAQDNYCSYHTGSSPTCMLWIARPERSFERRHEFHQHSAFSMPDE